MKEGEPSNFVVFILDGEFEILKERITEQDSELLDFLDE